MDWIPHAIVILTALMHTVTSQVVQLSKCYKCASAPTNEGRRYLDLVKEDYKRIGYTEFDDVYSPCGDPFTRSAGSNLWTCDNGYGCIKTRIELANNQVVMFRGCAKYNVCSGDKITNAPTPRGDVKVKNYCCHDPYCNKSNAIHTNMLLVVFGVALAVMRSIL